MLLATCAWLLGAVSVTAGSMYAVSRFGPALVDLHSNEVTADWVQANLKSDPVSATPTTSPSPSPSGSPSRRARRRHHAPNTPHSAGYPQGTLVSSPDGWADALCLPTGAYLVRWVPVQGYYADRHVVQGPASFASVTFRSNSSGRGVTITVRCNGPVLLPPTVGRRPNHPDH
jgi:hypothetical protein